MSKNLFAEHKITPANFEEFAGFLMFKKNVPAEQCPLNISEVTDEMVHKYGHEFFQTQRLKDSLSKVTIPQTVLFAIRTSLDNSILVRRKTNQYTFMSDMLDPEVIKQALVVINQRLVGTTEYVSAANPLVSLLKLDERPELLGLQWQSVISGGSLPPTMKLSSIRSRYNPDEILMPADILSSHVTLDLYHPYIWHLISQDRLDEIVSFIDTYECKIFIDYAVEFLKKTRYKSPINNLL